MSPQRKGRKIANKLSWNRCRIQDRAEAAVRAEMIADIKKAMRPVVEHIQDTARAFVRQWIESPACGQAIEALKKQGVTIR